MTNKAEDVLFASISDVERMDTIAREQFALEIIPTEAGRPVIEWAIERYFESGRRTAPSVEAIREVWADVLDDAEIELSDGTEIEDTIEWSIDHLRSSYAHKESERFIRAFASGMSQANPPDRLGILDQAAETLFILSYSLASKSQQVVIERGLIEALGRYTYREETGSQVMGMTFGRGLADIDHHTFGIHPGELAVLAAGPKAGKSYFCAYVALSEWLAGRKVVLFTLENSIEMTTDRIMCLHMGIDSRRWARGQATENEKFRAQTFTNDIAPMISGDLQVLRPEPGQRSVRTMVRTAQMLGAESLIIDQLTFIESSDERAPRTSQIRQMTHDLKSLVSGKFPMSCLVAHQINREGVKAAQRTGYLEMFHLAEGSEVERTADLVCSLYQSDDARASQMAVFQILACRREDINAWLLDWNVRTGIVGVRSTATLGAQIVNNV